MNHLTISDSQVNEGSATETAWHPDATTEHQDLLHDTVQPTFEDESQPGNLVQLSVEQEGQAEETLQKVGGLESLLDEPVEQVAVEESHPGKAFRAIVVLESQSQELVQSTADEENHPQEHVGLIAKGESQSGETEQHIGEPLFDDPVHPTIEEDNQPNNAEQPTNGDGGRVGSRLSDSTYDVEDIRGVNTGTWVTTSQSLDTELGGDDDTRPREDFASREQSTNIASDFISESLGEGFGGNLEFDGYTDESATFTGRLPSDISKEQLDDRDEAGPDEAPREFFSKLDDITSYNSFPEVEDGLASRTMLDITNEQRVVNTEGDTPVSARFGDEKPVATAPDATTGNTEDPSASGVVHKEAQEHVPSVDLVSQTDDSYGLGRYSDSIPAPSSPKALSSVSKSALARHSRVNEGVYWNRPLVDVSEDTDGLRTLEGRLKPSDDTAESISSSGGVEPVHLVDGEAREGLETRLTNIDDPTNTIDPTYDEEWTGDEFSDGESLRVFDDNTAADTFYGTIHESQTLPLESFAHGDDGPFTLSTLTEGFQEGPFDITETGDALPASGLTEEQYTEAVLSSGTAPAQDYSDEQQNLPARMITNDAAEARARSGSDPKITSDLGYDDRLEGRASEEVIRVTVPETDDNAAQWNVPSELPSGAATSYPGPTNYARPTTAPARATTTFDGRWTGPAPDVGRGPPSDTTVVSNQFNMNDSGNYDYGYELSDGRLAWGRSRFTPGDEPETGGQVTQGGYRYWGDDGHEYTMEYTADEHGFRPVADHLPTPPPQIPEYQQLRQRYPMLFWAERADP